MVLPTAPRAARGPDISDDRIPTQPPFIAYISNLPYDVDEVDIGDFFSNMQVSLLFHSMVINWDFSCNICCAHYNLF